MPKISLPSADQVDTIIDQQYRDRIDAIVDLIGAEHLKLFLTYKDDPQYGPWCDLLNPRIKFQPHSPTGVDPVESGEWEAVSGGPLGAYIRRIKRSPGPILQRGIVESVGGSSSPPYYPKYATRIDWKEGTIGMVSAILRKQGTLPDAKFRLVVYTDDNGAPGVPVRQYDYFFPEGRVDPVFSDTNSLSGTDYRDIRMPLIAGLTTRSDRVHWLVFEYADMTGVDADNFVQWRYGALPGGARAYHDGTSWTVVPDESHDYKLYGDDIALTDEFTISVLVNRPVPVVEANLITFHGESRMVIGIWESNGLIQGRFSDVAGRTHSVAKPVDLKNWCVLTLTRKRDSVEGLAIYLNGSLIAASGHSFGGATSENYPIRRTGAARLPRAMSMVIGKIWRNTGLTYGSGWAGGIGPIVISDRCLSPDEVRVLANLMLHNKTAIEVE